MPIPFHDIYAEKVYSLPQSRGAGRRQAGTSYCRCSSSQLRSSHSENRTTERPVNRTHSGGSRDWTVPRMKRHPDLSPTYKSYWAWRKSLAVRKDILEHHWESTDRWSQVVQTILPHSRVNDVLTKLYGGPSGGHLDVNKTLNKVWQRYYCLQARNEVKKWCQQCDTCAASGDPWPSNWGPIWNDSHQCIMDFPTQRPRKPISRDCCRLLDQVARSLGHS
jgi:hypothetical protein